MITDPAILQKVRTLPLFAKLKDDQLDCIKLGEVVEVPAGTTLVLDGQPYSFFFVVVEGEVRIVRDYDRQTILMAVIKPGSFTGEITLLLDVPWMSTARTGKPATLFRLGQDEFFQMLA